MQVIKSELPGDRPPGIERRNLVQVQSEYLARPCGTCSVASGIGAVDGVDEQIHGG